MSRYGNNHRGGAPKGEKHGRAKLSDAKVRAMRAKYLAYIIGYETLAAEFGCGVSTARDICTFATRGTA